VPYQTISRIGTVACTML